MLEGEPSDDSVEFSSGIFGVASTSGSSGYKLENFGTIIKKGTSFEITQTLISESSCFSGSVSRHRFINVIRYKFRCRIVIYEMSARRQFSQMSALFEARATKERVLHLHLHF
jgi:hypothetical protein